MCHSLLDQLPMVVFHLLFTYFLPEEILVSLLDVSPYLNHIIKSYSNYQLNLKSIRLAHFDLICRHLSPDQIKILILSDDKDTPGQSQLFLFHFQFDQLINLQSLTLIQIERDSLRHIIPFLNQLKHLRTLSLKSESPVPLSLPLANLRYLELPQYTVDQLKPICLTTPRLKILNIIIEHRTSNFDFQCPLEHLTRLILQIHCKYFYKKILASISIVLGFQVRMNEIKKFLNNFPRLKHLDLRTRCHIDVTNGYAWELIAKDLLTFKFIFSIQLYSIVTILNTFRTSFWLEEKCWFVAYSAPHLYTIPCSKKSRLKDILLRSEYTTVFNPTIIYNHMTNLTLEKNFHEIGHRFNNIHTLEIECENILAKRLAMNVDLNRVKNLTLASAIKISEMRYLLNNMSGLQHLSIDTVRKKRLKIFISNEFYSIVYVRRNVR
jgi:hypothetical protein